MFLSLSETVGLLFALGAYVHFPFCKCVCAVCMHDLFSRYAAALAPLLFIDSLKPIKKCRHCKPVARQLKAESIKMMSFCRAGVAP